MIVPWYSGRGRFWRAGSAVLILAAFVAGCAQSRPGARSDNVPENAREVRVAAKLEQRRITIVEDLLIGEPGVRVTGREVRIRGSKEGPLWVIDGIYTNTPIGINPHDIARMWINASGHGYGRRGANGVVIVRTKVG